MADRGTKPGDLPVTGVAGARQGQPTSEAGSRPVKFDDPPVTETLLGVQFSPLRKLTLPYIGLYWATVRDAYPNHEVKAPLTPVTEEFPAPPPSESVGIQFSLEPEARCWFIDTTSTQLIQVQRDRFIRNWRKGAPPHERYPSYDELRPRFERDWAGFFQFLEHHNLGTPEINQCEVTYVNHIDLGRGWRSFGESAQVLSLLASPSTEFLPEAEMVLINARYVMPGGKGRLHVAAQPAMRRDDGKEVMQLSLTARGKPASSLVGDILAWFDVGHEWIVRGFADITTAKMQEIWGRR